LVGRNQDLPPNLEGGLFPCEKLADFPPHDVNTKHVFLAVLLVDPGRIATVAAVL
jgi:hypothetical protein